MSKIENVIFYPVSPTAKGLIGFANLIYSGELALNSIAVYTRPDGKGIRCLFPLRTLPNGRGVSIYHPIDAGVTHIITEAIEAKIKEVTKNVDKEEDDYGREK